MAPHPPGTLVRCIGSHGLPLRTSCETHIFQVGEYRAVEGYTHTGFIQIAKCLVCSYTTPPIDSDFFLIKADAFDLAGLSGELHEAIEHYTKVLDYIGRVMTGEVNPVPALMDYG